MATGAQWITAKETHLSVISERGSVREIRDILREVLAQYGLRAPVADAPSSLPNVPAAVNLLARRTAFAYASGSPHGNRVQNDSQFEGRCR